MEKEKFINEILNSTNGMAQVDPNDDLFFKIQSKIHNQNFVSNNLIWKVAASIVILISLNIFILEISNKKSKKLESVFDNVLNKNNQLY